MKLWRRVRIAILRNKSYLVYFGVLFLISHVLFGGFLVGEVSSTTVERMKNGIAPKVVLYLDVVNISEEGFTTLSLNDVERLGKLPEVKAYDYTNQMDLYHNSLKRIQTEEPESPLSHPDAFDFKGINYAPMIEVETGDMQLISGRVFTEQEVRDRAPVGLISLSLLEQNNLKVGDSVQFEHRLYEYTGDKTDHQSPPSISEKQGVDIQIIGVYQKKDLQSPIRDSISEHVTTLRNDQRKNELYVPAKLIDQIQEGGPNQNDTVSSNVVYMLNSMDDVESFVASASIGLPKGYQFETSQMRLTQVKASLQSSSEMGAMIVQGTFGLSIIVLLILEYLMVRERKVEIGIYLALGRSRRSLLTQFLLEMTTVLAAALLCSVLILQITGPFFVEQITNTELVQSVSSAPTSLIDDHFQQYEGAFLSYYQFHVPLFVMLFVGALMQISLMLGGIMIIIYILRLDVKDILLE